MFSGGFEKEKMRMESVEIWHKMSDLKRWAQILRSFLGMKDGGWVREDEERWDSAVEVLERNMRESKDCRRTDEGWELKFVANIAIVSK